MTCQCEQCYPTWQRECACCGQWFKAERLVVRGGIFASVVTSLWCEACDDEAKQDFESQCESLGLADNDQCIAED